MQVFKVSFKVLKRNAASLLIYVGIFLGLSILFASNSSEQEQGYTSFEPIRVPITVFAEEDTPLVQGLLTHLKKSAVLLPLEDTTNQIGDALYFRVTTYVLRIPEGFTQEFLKGDPTLLEKETLPDAVTSIYQDLAIERYFHTARLYQEAFEDLEEEELVQLTLETLGQETPITLTREASQRPSSYTRFYFNYMSYSLVSILVLGTSIVMLLWKEEGLYQRTEISPLKRSSIHLQKFLALGVFALLAFFLLSGAYFFLHPQATWDQQTKLHMLNAFFLTVTSLGMSFFIGTLLKSRNAITAVSNVVSLGPSFISGVFVPQQFLGEGVLAIAKLTPTYYYVTANERIAAMGDTMDASIWPLMGMLLLFGLVFYVLSFYLGRKETKTIWKG